MVEKTIWLDIALLCCIITCLRLVKIWPHTCAISSYIAFSLIKYIYIVNKNSLLPIITQLLRR